MDMDVEENRAFERGIERGRLYRSRKDHVVAGVCGGLARYFNVDPVLIRLGFVVLTLTSGIGLLAYLVLAFAVPQRPADQVESELFGEPFASRRGRDVVGYSLAGLGTLILAGNLGLYRLVNWDIVWPAVLVAVGVLLLVQRDQR